MIAARMLTCCLLALSATSLTGCQQRPTTLYHVSGKVFYKGDVVRGGLIVFSPDTSRGESGKIAIGKILDDGSYTISTADAVGATAGWYRVTVAALVGPVSLNSLIHEKYRDPQLSQLQCEVKANQDNHLDFNLD